MNFLAHIFLSHKNEDWMIGNLIADFISNKDLPELSEGVRQGVFVHRKIDTFTDGHPAVRSSIKKLHSPFKKYAPVVADIYYDYLLVNNWRNYTNVHFDSFCDSVYQIMRNRMNEIPPRLKVNLPKMIEHNWLKNYGTAEGLQFTFDRFSKRVTFEADFSNAAAILINQQNEFNEDFNLFFPDMLEYVEKDLTTT
ncbi:MAG: ACP phosphodiesterase [Saprospiraceae bacterium]